MAILPNLPSSAQIASLAGILDFYYYKGIPCVRSWPNKPTKTKAIKRTWANMRNGNLLWKGVKQVDVEALTYASKASELTNRDMFLANVLIMNTPRSVVAMESIHLIGNYIFVNFDLIQGDKPLMSVNWLDHDGASAYVRWSMSSARTRGYPFGKRDTPHFKTGYMKTISWLNGHGFVVFKNRFRVLFFHFVDPHKIIKFCSGVYHNDFRV